MAQIGTARQSVKTTLFKATMFAASKSGSVVDAKDPQFNYVTMLLHGDNTNGAQNNTFLDSSTNNFTITRNGNTTQGTFTPYGNNWSNFFDGDGDTLDVPTSANNSVGTGSFCFEAYIFMQDSSAQQFLVANASSGGLWIGFNIDSANKLAIGRVGTAIDNEVSYTWTNGTWYHLAVNRNGTNLQFFVNGTQVGATGTNSVNYPSQGYRIGSETTQKYFKGYISNFRLVRASVYTTTFTPSTTPLTAIANTALLTCADNRFIDDSTNNFTITRNGDVSVQRFSPFSPTSAYSTSVIGGSGYFDGSGDYLSAASNAAFDVWGGNFTLEMFVYLTATPSNVVFFQWGSGTYLMQLESDSSGGSFFGTYYYNAPTETNSIRSSTIPSTNQWNHIALTKSGSTWALFLNGTRLGTSTSTNYVTGNLPISIGANSSGAQALQGYISNVRLVKGTAVYDPTVSTLTVPTAPLTAITNTSLLLNYTNAGILDNAMMNDLETVGNAQISTSVKKYGTGSLAFDGTGDWLVTSYTPNNALGSGDFTVEAFIYKNTNAAYMAVAGTMTSAAPYNTKWQLFSDAGGTKISWCTEAFLITSSATLSTGTWYHIAFVRSSGTLKLYIDGVFDSSSSDTRNYNAVGELWVGQVPENVSGRAWNGYIDEFRISKFARYTANFTVPTVAFPNK
jgi:hypothetical protein